MGQRMGQRMFRYAATRAEREGRDPAPLLTFVVILFAGFIFITAWATAMQVFGPIFVLFITSIAAVIAAGKLIEMRGNRRR